MKFERRYSEIRAVQWDGSNLDDIKSFLSFQEMTNACSLNVLENPHNKARAILIVTMKLAVDENPFEIVILPSSWLVKDARSGATKMMSGKELAREYQYVSDVFTEKFEEAFRSARFQ